MKSFCHALIAVLLAAARPDLVGAVSLLAGNTFPDTPIPFPLSLVTAPVIGGLLSRLLFSTPSLNLMLRQGTGPGSAPPDAGVYLGDSGQDTTPQPASKRVRSRGTDRTAGPDRARRG